MGPPSHRSSVPDRLATYAVVIGAVLAAAHLGGAFAEGGEVWRGVLSRLGAALAILAAGCGVGWVGARVGSVMSRVNDLSRQMSATDADQATESREIVDRLETLILSIKPSRSKSPVDTASPDAIPEPTPDAVATGASPAAAPAQTDAVSNDRIVTLLEEIREIALLNDEQRQLLLKQHVEARRRSALDQAFLCFRTGQWAVADGLLSQLEAQFPADSAVKQARGEFQRQRAAAEDDAFFKTDQRVRDLVQVNSYERAAATAQEFINNFPAHVDGRHLLTQVHRDHEAFLEASFQRMYEQVQANVDRRQWRSALVDAQRLLEDFPTHSRANRIRLQLQTISANAEIEERQDHEVRIQLLLKNRRFTEAVELAEEVVRRFPDSPQADALEDRLPQLRELAEHGDGNGA